MRTVIADFAHRHAGRAAVVVGGAPSRLNEIERCPQDAVWFSTNQHGLLARARCNLGCDYIAASDAIGASLKGRGAPVLSPQRYADVMVFERRVPNSAALGCWSAWVMGCAPIIPIGIECYQGATYAHDPAAVSSGQRLTLAQHLARWQVLAEIAPGAMIRAVGGPLLEVFPRYDPAEPVPPPADIETVRKAAAGVMLKFTRHEGEFERGEMAQFSKSEAMRLIASGAAVRA